MVTVVSTVPHQSVVKEVICKSCGATLQYVPNEIKSKVVSDYTGDKDTEYYIDCPNCNKNVHVKGF